MLPGTKNVRHLKTQRSPPDLIGLTIYIQLGLGTFFFPYYSPLLISSLETDQPTF